MYTVVMVYGITVIYHGHCFIHGYKLFDVIVQATYTIVLLWFIRIARSEAAFKPFGFASWFKRPPLAYNSSVTTFV